MAQRHDQHPDASKRQPTGRLRFRLGLLAVLVAASLTAAPGTCAQQSPDASAGGQSGQPSPQPSLQPFPGRFPVEIVVFWEPGCPYCLKARQFLEGLEPSTRAWLDIKAYDISASEAAQHLFVRTNAYFDIASPGVPLITVGSVPFLGFDASDTTGREILATARACRVNGCPELVEVLAGERTAPGGAGGTGGGQPPPRLHLPWIGELDLAQWSLPALTLVLAAVDGFNPCAMWVLVFLIGLLVGMQDRARMWLLGGAFLLTSGVVYFAFLAAWLNLFLFLGALSWIRLAVGAVALASGAFYLREFLRNAAAECQVTDPGQRQRIMAAFRASVSERRFLAAIGGVMVLAAAVNIIELLCSAGIPAVYTGVLAINALSAWQHYAYLTLYVVVFMIDDMAIFAIAMLTLAATGMTTRYLRVSHLVGGMVMVSLGALLIFAPDWLAVLS